MRAINEIEMMITKSEIAEMRKRLDATTPGEWVSCIEGRDHTSGSDFIMTGVGGERGPDIELTGATQQDHDFIASARQDMEALIAEVERLWVERREYPPQ